MILLNRVKSLLLFTICREECAFLRGRLDVDEAAVTLTPALGSDVPRGEYSSHFCQILYFVFAVQQG
jgi:hypothetical protein